MPLFQFNKVTARQFYFNEDGKDELIQICQKLKALEQLMARLKARKQMTSLTMDGRKEVVAVAKTLYGGWADAMVGW